MKNVIYAATPFGYAVQVLDGSEVSYEYSAGNHLPGFPGHHGPRL